MDKSKNDKTREFMVDFMWEKKTSITNQIILAMECEWSNTIDQHEYDFRKLVYIKSLYKIFLFQMPLRSDPKIRVSEIKTVINKCRITQKPKDSYLFISHRDSRKKDKLTLIINGYILDNTGKIVTLAEEPILF